MSSIDEQLPFENRPAVMFLLYYLLFLCIQDLHVHVVAIAKVFWEVQSHPVVFGESVTLYCNTSSVQAVCEQCTRRWYGGKDLYLLSFNNYTLDHTKYETTEDSNGFALVIKHFDERDFNELYSCTFGFFSDKKKLQLTNDFEIQPINQTVDITHNVNSGSVLNIKVDFKKVHPPPICHIFLNEDNLSSKLITKQHPEGFFYTVTVDFQHNLKPNHCMDKVQLDCTIGTRNTTIVSTNLNSRCSVENSVKDLKKEVVNNVALGVGILLLLLLVLAGTIIICLYKRKKGGKGKVQKQQESPSHSKQIDPEMKEETRKMLNEDKQTSDLIVLS